MKKAFYPLITSLLLSFGLSAQLYIDQSVSPEVMMMDFFNTASATVSNVQANGDISIAFFEGANANLGLNAGIYLSTGNVFDAIGQNESESTSGAASSGSDMDLEMIANTVINQHSLIEMDVVPSTEMLNFKYVFASEEYCEFVNSAFNDVFGFFVSGPGISGPHQDNGINIAMLPDGSAAAINSVNHELNNNFFIGNSGTCGTAVLNNFISFDGLTVTMDAELAVVPGETYHVRIGVGDASDGIFDSGVFIGIESLGGDPFLTPPSQFSVDVNSGMFSVENESKYATSYLWDFGDGFTSTEKNPGTHIYDFSTQSEYTLTLTTENYCCTDTYSIVVNENMGSPSAALASNSQETCVSESIEFTDESTGDIASWEWTFAGGTPATSDEQNPTVIYDEAGIYDVSLTVTASNGMTSTFSEEGYINVLPAPIAAFEVSDLGNGNFQITSTSQNTDSYLWEFGDGMTSTETNPTHAYTASGEFDITLTASNDCGTNTTTISVESILSSVNEHPELQAIHFFPNPAKDQMTINGLNETAELQVYNPLGQLVLSNTIQPNENLNVAEWTRGLYMITIQLAGHEKPAVRRVLLK